jgi:hypothetical protein
MKLSTYLAAAAVVEFVYGALLVLFPDKTVAFFGLEAGSAAMVLARLVGAIVLAVGIVTVLARGAGEAIARRILVPGFLGGYALLFAVTLVAQAGKAANTYGWINIALTGLFALGAVYYMWTMPVGQAAPAAKRAAAPARRSGSASKRRK